jgi:hypothetical protein
MVKAQVAAGYRELDSEGEVELSVAVEDPGTESKAKRSKKGVKLTTPQGGKRERACSKAQKVGLMLSSDGAEPFSVSALGSASAAVLASLWSGAEARAMARARARRWLVDGVSSAPARPGAALRQLALLAFLAAVTAVALQHALGVLSAGPPVEVTLPPTAPPTEEEIPAMMPGTRKKITRADEIVFACEEVSCIEKCARKVTTKCSVSESCMKTRVAACKKKCRRTRCLARCKVEPKLGYVERDEKLTRCKDDCANDSACQDKCDVAFQGCKTKCGDRRRQFKCDREPEISFSSAPKKGGEGEGDEDGAGDAAAEDDTAEADAEDGEGDDGVDAGADADDQDI